jgi:hypothetical protein
MALELQTLANHGRNVHPDRAVRRVRAAGLTNSHSSKDEYPRLLWWNSGASLVEFCLLNLCLLRFALLLDWSIGRYLDSDHGGSSAIDQCRFGLRRRAPSCDGSRLAGDEGEYGTLGVRDGGVAREGDEHSGAAQEDERGQQRRVCGG